MKYQNPSLSQEKEIYDLRAEYSDTILRQKQSGRYCPIIISGNTGSGKDTILKAVHQVLEGDFGIEIQATRSRFLTRPQRIGEEKSPLNFIKADDFNKRTFGFRYNFGGNQYGLDGTILQEELGENNISFVNGSPGKLLELYKYLLQILQPETLPPCIIYLSIDQVANQCLLIKRGGTSKEIRERLKIIGESEYQGGFPDIIQKIKREPQLDKSHNQDNFNQDVISAIKLILGHIQKYINMTPEETQAK